MLIMFCSEVSESTRAIAFYDVRVEVGSSSSSSTTTGVGISRLLRITNVSWTASVRECLALIISLEVTHAVGELVGGAGQFTYLVLAYCYFEEPG